jgi:hypothetical protein
VCAFSTCRICGRTGLAVRRAINVGCSCPIIPESPGGFAGIRIVSHFDAVDYDRRCIERVVGGGLKPEDFKEEMQRCSTAMQGMMLSPAMAVRTLLFQERSDEGQALWGMILD